MTADWRALGDTTIDAWVAELERLGSPVLAEAAATHEAARPHTRLALAMAFHETKHGTLFTVPGFDAGFKNPLALMADGRYARFPSWAAAFAEWRRRLTDPAYKAGVYARTRNLADLVHVYAPASAGNDEERYVEVVTERLAAFPKEHRTMATKPKILITRGHGTTGDAGAFAGGQSEEDHNKRIVPAIVAALRGAGYDVSTFPSPDPAADVPGTLDTEGMYARTWMLNTPGEVAMIDCHLESSPAAGIFAIVANGTGLVTGAAGAQPATDTWANNVGDRALGKAIVEEIHARTGIPIRTAWVKEPGLMSEDMTYVGQGGGGQYPPSRLAMFGYTAEFHQRAHRLVVEFANLQNDRAYYTAPTFPQQCGAGVLAAVNRVFGQTSQPASTSLFPEGMDEGIAGLLFGTLTRDGRVYRFDPDGAVSKLWLAEGARTGVYPTLEDVRTFGTRSYFVFRNGLVLWRPNTRAAVRVLTQNRPRAA